MELLSTMELQGKALGAVREVDRLILEVRRAHTAGELAGSMISGPDFCPLDGSAVTAAPSDEERVLRCRTCGYEFVAPLTPRVVAGETPGDSSGLLRKLSDRWGRRG